MGKCREDQFGALERRVIRSHKRDVAPAETRPLAALLIRGRKREVEGRMARYQ